MTSLTTPRTGAVVDAVARILNDQLHGSGRYVVPTVVDRVVDAVAIYGVPGLGDRPVVIAITREGIARRMVAQVVPDEGPGPGSPGYADTLAYRLSLELGTGRLSPPAVTPAEVIPTPSTPADVAAHLARLLDAAARWTAQRWADVDEIRESFDRRARVVDAVVTGSTRTLYDGTHRVGIMDRGGCAGTVTVRTDGRCSVDLTGVPLAQVLRILDALGD